MARGHRVATLGVGIAATLCLLTGVAVALPFDATVSTLDDVHLTGAIRLGLGDTASAAAVWTPTLASAPTLSPGRYLLNTFEASWTMAAGHLVATASKERDVGFAVSSQQTVLSDPAVELLALDPEARWAMASEVAQGSGLDLDGARCAVGIASTAEINLTESQDVAYSSRIWKRDNAPTLRALCDVASLRSDGRTSWTVFGTSLRVAFFDGGGARATKDVTTGVFSAKDPENPDHTRFRFVRASITPDGKGSSVAFPSTVGLLVYSAGLGVAGQVDIPAASGNVQWGTQQLTNPQNPVRPSGTFTLRPASGGQIAVHGQASDPWEALAVGAGAAVAVGAGLRYGPAMIQGLFTRLTQANTLGHPRRREIVETVRAMPGLQAADLARILELQPRSVQYHTNMLVRQGILVRRTFGRSTALFVAGQVPPGSEWRLHRVQRFPLQKVVTALERAPATQRELVSATGLSQSRVSKVLSELVGLGVISQGRRGRQLVYEIHP